jgi:hypothetical protein
LTRSQSAPLSSNEAVTLRRVAYGQSNVDHLRSQDLTRLRLLKLIEGSAREPTLTADGKRQFDALPKAAALTAFTPHDELVSAMTRVLGEKRRQ